MPAVLDSLAPATGAPGTEITLAGSGFAAGAQVNFQAQSRGAVVAAVFDSDTQLRVTAPDAFDGEAAALTVSVANAGEDPTSGVAFALDAWPPIESVYPLVSLAALKRSMGLAAEETARDAKLREQIDFASSQIAAECGRTFRTTVITGELHDGADSAVLWPRSTPVVSVEALAIAGDAIDLAELKVYQDKIAFEHLPEYSARLRGFQRVFPRGRQNVSVDYTAGYAAIPAEIARAVILQVTYWENVAYRQGLPSESVDGVNSQYSQAALSPAVRTICSRYRRTRLGVV